ncbi:hypothetical protein D3C76_1222610 [compost metagenome]
MEHIMAKYTRAGAAPSCLNAITVIKEPNHQIVVDMIHMKRNDTLSLSQMTIQHMKSRNMGQLGHQNVQHFPFSKLDSLSTHFLF